MADSLTGVVVELQKQITCMRLCVQNFGRQVGYGTYYCELREKESFSQRRREKIEPIEVKQRTRIELSAFER